MERDGNRKDGELEALGPPDPENGSHEPKRSFRSRRRQPWALVVDDDPLVRRAVARQLGRRFEVHHAASVRSALAALEVAAIVDLAFVDFELPDGTGVEVLRRLADWPDAIRVLMSGNIRRVSEFRRCGAWVPLVLEKPLNSASVEAAKRAALKGLYN